MKNLQGVLVRLWVLLDSFALHMRPLLLVILLFLCLIMMAMFLKQVELHGRVTYLERLLHIGH